MAAIVDVIGATDALFVAKVVTAAVGKAGCFNLANFNQIFETAGGK